MENVLLVVHLILSLCVIAIVLLQRSEGGGLGMGGGGGGVMSGRAAATALGKLTWIFAIGFLITSIALTVLAARNAARDSVIERLGSDQPAAAGAPALPAGSDLLPPTATDAPAPPPRAE